MSATNSAEKVGAQRKLVLQGIDDEGQTFTRMFTVTDKIAKGASAVCYRAFHEQSGLGVLKELCPVSADVVRHKDGSLEIQSDVSRFVEESERYLRPYQKVLDLKRTHPDLGTFLPDFQVFTRRASDPEQPPIMYIWEESAETETFEAVCADNHENAKKDAGQKVLTTLRAGKLLAECVCSMHHAGLLHRDIKPSNFGFVKRGGVIRADTISFFDIDTVCTIDERNPPQVASPGFTERRNITNPSPTGDIYSIGASLFCALVVDMTVDAEGGVYRERYYDKLDDIVERSELLEALDPKVAPRVQKSVARILKKCLGPRNVRYESCEDLINDLDEAIYWTLPFEFLEDFRSHHWVLEDIEPLLDDPKRRIAALCIGTHCYKHPLLSVTERSATPRILICGFDANAQLYLDTILQLLQVPGSKPVVQVLCDNPGQKDEYLRNRHFLSKFFIVDGVEVTGEDYGSITFMDLSGRQDSWEPVIGAYMAGDDNQRVCAAFVSLGDDRRNLRMAREICRISQESGDTVQTSFVWNNDSSFAPQRGLFAVATEGNFKKDPEFCTLERLAFNVQLLWEKSLDVDFEVIKDRFHDPYNYYSCFSSVLALFYRLLSIGIDPKACSFEEAAARYSAQVLSKTDVAEKQRDAFIAAEHRRWVTEKICDGWGPVEDINDCVAFPATAKLKDKRQHACIVRSGANHNLQRLTQEYGTAYWDNADECIAESLDELDQFSLRFHRELAKKADGLIASDVTSGNLALEIRNLCSINEEGSSNKDVLAAFETWRTCMVDIANGQSNRVAAYEKLRDSFAKRAQTLPQETADLVAAHIGLLDRRFLPFLAAQRYEDYKAIDAALVDGAPFILTYSLATCMFVPLHTGTSTALFNNVAAATVVNPAVLLYGVMIEDPNELENVAEALHAANAYLRQKNLRAGILVFIACRQGLKGFLKENLPKVMPPGIRVGLLSSRDPEQIAKGLTQWTSANCGDGPLLLEKNGAPLSYLLQGSGFYNGGASYRFDSRREVFFDMTGCEFLEHINKWAFMTVEDMLSLQQSCGTRSNLFDYFDDYKKLWNEYTKDRTTWKNLCELLKEDSEKWGNHKRIVYFKLNAPADSGEVVYRLPQRCVDLAVRIAKAMFDAGLVGKITCLPCRHGSQFELRLDGRRGYRSLYDAVFTEDVLSTEKPPQYYVSGDYFDIDRVDLSVSGFRIPAGWVSFEWKYWGLLETFQKLGYITGLRKDESGWHFKYTSLAAKELLTVAGRILELHVFYSAILSDHFDDIVTGCEVEWGKIGDARNEFDLILTKGFRSIFVECKTTNTLAQDYYYKLSTLCRLFGVNATAVLLSDPAMSHLNANSTSSVNKRRGNVLNIITVDAPEDPARLGELLNDIIDGK